MIHSLTIILLKYLRKYLSGIKKEKNTFEIQCDKKVAENCHLEERMTTLAHSENKTLRDTACYLDQTLPLMENDKNPVLRIGTLLAPANLTTVKRYNAPSRRRASST